MEHDDGSAGYIDPEYGRWVAQERARSQALVEQWRREAAIHGPRVVMNKCSVCRTVIGPSEQTRGQWACSQECIDRYQREQEAEERRKSWDSWMVHRHGCDSRWPGAVNL
ncbi:hypothetical protein [Nocardia cyriacigeorgica]|uniref:hypothetical protein n=1 Tax=Nocardia cyriacigeorgica TaxID=135487 RepID=UPI002454264E|nr:hypothetical protein [Nocardia cyriacigeorgica]